MKTHEQILRAVSATRSGPRPGTRHRLLYLSLLLLAFSTNCGGLQGAVPILGPLFPGKSGRMNKQTRMFGERVLFVTQNMPTLLRWQTELLSVNAVEMPAVQQLISNSTQLSVSVERFAYVAEQLPKQISTEREGIVKVLQTQEKDIASLLGQGTQFSASLNTTFTPRSFTASWSPA